MSALCARRRWPRLYEGIIFEWDAVTLSDLPSLHCRQGRRLHTTAGAHSLSSAAVVFVEAESHPEGGASDPSALATACVAARAVGGLDANEPVLALGGCCKRRQQTTTIRKESQDYIRSHRDCLLGFDHSKYLYSFACTRRLFFPTHGHGSC